MSKSSATSVLNKATSKVRVKPSALLNMRPRSSRLMTKVVMLGDFSIQLFSIGYLAQSIDRDTTTIRRWERRSIIPKPSITTKDGVRWYMQEELDMYTLLVDRHDMRSGKAIDSTDFTKDAFEERKILVDKLTKMQKKGQSSES